MMEAAHEKDAAKSPSTATKNKDADPKVGGVGGQQSAPKKKRKSPEKPWKKPKDMPKRPLSAYNLFFRDERERLKSSLSDPVEQQDTPAKQDVAPKKTSGLGFAKLAQTVAAKWKGLDSVTRAPYERQAAIDKARYDKAVAIWREEQRRKKENPLYGEASHSMVPARQSTELDSTIAFGERKNSTDSHSPSSKGSYPQDWFEAPPFEGFSVEAPQNRDPGNGSNDEFLLAPTSPVQEPWSGSGSSHAQLSRPSQPPQPSQFHNQTTRQETTITEAEPTQHEFHNQHVQLNILNTRETTTPNIFHNQFTAQQAQQHLDAEQQNIFHNPFPSGNDGTAETETTNIFHNPPPRPSHRGIYPEPQEATHPQLSSGTTTTEPIQPFITTARGASAHGVPSFDLFNSPLSPDACTITGHQQSPYFTPSDVEHLMGEQSVGQPVDASGRNIYPSDLFGSQGRAASSAAAAAAFIAPRTSAIARNQSDEHESAVAAARLRQEFQPSTDLFAGGAHPGVPLQSTRHLSFREHAPLQLTQFGGHQQQDENDESGVEDFLARYPPDPPNS